MQKNLNHLNLSGPGQNRKKNWSGLGQSFVICFGPGRNFYFYIGPGRARPDLKIKNRPQKNPARADLYLLSIPRDFFFNLPSSQSITVLENENNGFSNK